MEKYLLILLVLFIGAKETKAQGLEDMANYPATPQTSSLFKALAAPVSYYTGQPEISIPIYTISQDGVEVPINLSFNTSGIFVTEEATSLGLGVSLNWGGSIIRSLNGAPDENGFFTDPYIIGDLSKELPKNYSNYTSAICYPYCTDNASLEELDKRIKVYHNVNEYNDPYKPSPGPPSSDLRPDDFNYNVLGKSGLFKFNQANRKFITFPLDDIKIENISAPYTLQKFQITKSDGVKIILGDGAVEYVEKNVQSYIQSWFIKKITTLKNSTIDFSYINNQYWKSNPRNSELRIPHPPGGYESGGYDTYMYHEKLIQTINFKEGRLDFVYANDRTDISATETNVNLPNSGQPAPRLSQIILSDINNKKIRTYQFYHSYFIGNQPSSPVDNNRLKLDSLSIMDNTSKSIQKYKFEYNLSTTMPSKKSYARDHWGYYNGANNNSSLIPSTLVPLDFSTNDFGMSWSGYDNLHDYYSRSLKGNRFVNSDTNKIFTLKKIKFPTGGEREFVFDDNEVRWYELFSQMKDISNDGFDVISERLMVQGHSILESYPEPLLVEAYGKEKTVYGNEFTVKDFNDVVSGEASIYMRTNFVNPSILINQLFSSTYEIQIGLEIKSDNGFRPYITFTTINRRDANLNQNYQKSIYKKLPLLPDGIYRIYVKMITPDAEVVKNWSRFGHNTVVGLTYRKKNLSNIRVGGLRIREIIDRESTNEYKTTYDYTSADNYSSGHLTNIPEYKEYFATVTPSTTQTSTGNYSNPYYGYSISSEPVFPLIKTQGSNVGYTNVIKKVIGNTETIKEEFVYNFTRSLQKGYMKEYYKQTEPKPWQSGKLLSNKKFRDNVLISEDVFDYYGLNNETDRGFVEEINTSLIAGSVYERAGFNNDRWNLSIDRRHDNPVTYSGGTVNVGLYYFDTRRDFVMGNINNFSVINVSPPAKIPYFKIYTGFDKLKSKTTKSYFKEGIVEESENYFYNTTPTSLQLTSQTTTNSKGETLETKYFYPQDPEMANEPFVKDLIAGNRIGAPLNTQTYRGQTKVAEQKTVYDKSIETSNLLLPKYILENKGTAALNAAIDKKISYDLYDDKGNLLQYTQEGATPVSIVWGYDRSLPVVKIENHVYKTLGTYWIKGVQDASSSDKGTESSMIAALNNFTYSGSGLNNTIITTYMYKPLIGVSRITDANWMPTYYDYDSFNRLKFIKDSQQNVLEAYCYNYKGQIMDCSLDVAPIYSNVPMSKIFYKANCPSGYKAPVKYNISTGMFTSVISQEDADDKAKAYFESNGQANANRVGYCAYWNNEKSGVFTKNNCKGGATADPVTYTIPAETLYGLVSQEQADQNAQNAVNANGQAYANTNGICTFKNKRISRLFIKRNCEESSVLNEPVSYIIEAGKYISTISQADADAKASVDLNSNGQEYANANGSCFYKSIAINRFFLKNDCGSNGAPSAEIYYVIEAGKYTSGISQADADNQALAEGQALANSNGTCGFKNVAKSGLFTKNDCSGFKTPEVVSYVVAAGTYTSTTSQEAADYLAQQDVDANGQEYANSNGGCTP